MTLIWVGLSPHLSSHCVPLHVFNNCVCSQISYESLRPCAASYQFRDQTFISQTKRTFLEYPNPHPTNPCLLSDRNTSSKVGIISGAYLDAANCTDKFSRPIILERFWIFRLIFTLRSNLDLCGAARIVNSTCIYIDQPQLAQPGLDPIATV